MAFEIRMASGYRIIVDRLEEGDPLIPPGEVLGKVGYHEDGCHGIIYAHGEGEEIWVACAKFGLNQCHLGFTVSSEVNTLRKLKAYLEGLAEGPQSQGGEADVLPA